MDTSKTVDVVMCTYNGERYLREQLDSIIGQTYPIHRLIVQDDRSTDGTVAIVREYAARYPFISLYVNGRNLGYNLNFKSAVMRATADFVAISDQDDVWFADKIARQVEAIGGHNICFSAHVRGSRLEGARRVEPQHSLKALLFHGFAGHTMLLRRDYVQREGAWLDCIIYDWSLALNAYFYRDKAITYIAEPLNWHRTHPDEAGRWAFCRRRSCRPWPACPLCGGLPPLPPAAAQGQVAPPLHPCLCPDGIGCVAHRAHHGPLHALAGRIAVAAPVPLLHEASPFHIL